MILKGKKLFLSRVAYVCLLRVGNMWTVFKTVAQIPRKESGWFSMPLFQAKVCLHFIGPAAEERESVL
jgi:hypothetical protein